MLAPGDPRHRCDELEDRVFTHYGESFDVDFVEERFRCDEALANQLDIDGLFFRIRRVVSAPLDELTLMTLGESEPLGKSLLLFFWSYHTQRKGFSAEDLTRLRELVEANPRGCPLDAAYVAYMLVADRPEFVEQGEPIVAALATNPSVKSALVQTLVRCRFGHALLLEGKYALALPQLECAAELAERHRLLTILSARWHLADYRWRGGDVEAALALHRDEQLRTLARRFDKHGWLLQSHNAAIKCATDLGQHEVVRQEIETASRLLSRIPGDTHRLAVADFHHFRGEFLWRTGERELGRSSINRAIELYEEAGARRAATNAGVTLVELDSELGDSELLRARLGELDQRAEEGNYNVVRGRLAVIRRRLQRGEPRS